MTTEIDGPAQRASFSSETLAFLGAALLAGGLFTPVISIPVIGSVNLFNNGGNEIAVILLMLAGLGAVLAAKGREADVIWPGAASAAILLFLFGRLQWALSNMRSTLEKELAGNPFAGLARTAAGSVQLQWGWLIVGLGAGLLVAAGLKARRRADIGTFEVRDPTGRILAAGSLLLAVVAIGLGLTIGAPGSAAGAPAAAVPAAAAPSTDTASGPTAEEAAYIARSLKVYDLEAKYFESMLDGRVPGVRFKLRNDGNRTLNKVTVRVVFQDAAGKAIAEEEFNPVLVSDYSVGDDNSPLRPNYIWQQEPDKFWQAKNVPSEWSEGKATATITDIEFAPNG